MTFSKDELKLIAFCAPLSLSGLVPTGGGMPLAWFSLVFEKPHQLQRAVDKLRIGGYIVVDPFKQELRLLPRPVANVLQEFSGTPALFQNERPLDAAMADAERLQSVPVGKFPVLTEKSQPVTRPPPGTGTAESPRVPHEIMPKLMSSMSSMPMSSMPSPGKSHVHGTCNSVGIKKLHGTMSHEVGELAARTTTEIMADIVKLSPGLSQDHLDHWERRIDEDAELVNAIVRQGRLQRRTIRNIAAWMNAAYLNAINKPMKDQKPA